MKSIPKCLFLKLTQGMCLLLACAEEDGSGAMDFCQVVDIDSNDKDPQCCSVYAADIYDNINVAEVFSYTIPSAYIFPQLI